MENTIRSSLFETIRGLIHRLSSSGEGTGGKHFDLLRMSDTGTGVNDLLSGFLEVLRESSKLLYFSFDEGVTQLLYGAINDGLIGLSRFEDPLAKRIEGGLGPVAGSCAKFDREHGVSFAHGEVGARADIVEYEMYVFGLALVVVCVVDGRGNAKSPVGPVLNKWRSWVCVARRVVNNVWVGAPYYDRGSRRSDTVQEWRWRSDVVGQRP